MKKIVIIGGGTGTYTLLSGLRQFPSENSVIVSTADDGGSGGKLRNELGVLPPGDFRQCLLGLSYTDESLKEVFGYRFSKGSLAGHTVGNILLAASELVTKNAESGIELIGRILNTRGSVVPVSLKQTVLSAKLDNGKTIKGEHNIDEPESKKPYLIKDLSLMPKVSANPKALNLIKEADVVVFGPGDLYTSTIPNLLVSGIRDALKKSKAKKVLVVNLMTKFGQTQGFSSTDFVKEFIKYAGEKILDYVIVNTKKPDSSTLKLYSKEKAGFMDAKINELESLGVRVLSADLVSRVKYKKVAGDTLNRSHLRHDSNKLAQILWEL